MKKIFLLWNNHTVGCARFSFLLLIPAAIWQPFGMVLANSLLILWLIVKTGYEKGWDKEAEQALKGGEE